MTDTDRTNDIEPWEPTGPEATPPTDTPSRSGRNRKIAIVGGAAAVIGLGAIAAPVLAQTITGHDREDTEHQQFEKDLAAKLGVPQSKVDDALKSMQGDRLAQRVDELQQSGALTADQASAIKAKVASGDVQGAFADLRAAMLTSGLTALVKQGAITQDQADQVAALVRAGVPVGLRVPPPGAPGTQQPQHVETPAHQTQQVQELQQRGALTADEATAITDLIAAGKTAEAETAIHAAMDAGMLKQLVKAGTITQDQADQITSLQQAGVPIGIGGPGQDGGPGRGGPGDMDGDHGMGGDHPLGGDRDGDHHGPPLDGGQQGEDGGAQSGQFQPQSFDGGSNA